MKVSTVKPIPIGSVGVQAKYVSTRYQQVQAVLMVTVGRYPNTSMAGAAHLVLTAECKTVQPNGVGLTSGQNMLSAMAAVQVQLRL